MGAYTLSGAVAFNGIPLARCMYVVAQSWDTIKDAFVETQVEEQILMLGNAGTCAAAATMAVARASNNMHEDEVDGGVDAACAEITC